MKGIKPGVWFRSVGAGLAAALIAGAVCSAFLLDVSSSTRLRQDRWIIWGLTFATTLASWFLVAVPTAGLAVSLRRRMNKVFILAPIAILLLGFGHYSWRHGLSNPAGGRQAVTFEFWLTALVAECVICILLSRSLFGGTSAGTPFTKEK